MITKLVYVLTCSPEAMYIEQALMSVWSARHWNPDAHIVLIEDDKTDALLTGNRAEILNYISEKIVVPFEDDSLPPMYRSRWIKTRVRQLIQGDFLFVDCDTICQRALDEVDTFNCEIGAVLESHLLVSDYCDGLYRKAKQVTATIGVDLDDEQRYFSSGVLLVRDTKKAHELYEKWHQYWKEGLSMGLKIDQPALAKANRGMGHIIQQIPDTYNCILFTHPPFVQEAHILHIAAYHNPSFLFFDKVLSYVRQEGLTEWIKRNIVHPCDTMLPFDYTIKHSSIKQRVMWICSFASTASTLAVNIPSLLDEFFGKSSPKVILRLIHMRCYGVAAVCWMGWKRIYVLRKKGQKGNLCRKQ